MTAYFSVCLLARLVSLPFRQAKVLQSGARLFPREQICSDFSVHAVHDMHAVCASICAHWSLISIVYPPNECFPIICNSNLIIFFVIFDLAVFDLFFFCLVSALFLTLI